MAKRVKSANDFIVIDGWETVDYSIKAIGECQNQIARIEAAADIVINAAKSDAAKAVKPLDEKITSLLNALEHFAEEHKQEFKDEKSRVLNFGKLGWRKSTKIDIPKKVAVTIIEKIKEVFGNTKSKLYLNIKETPNKEALGKLTDEELAGLGARRKSTDDFFVEPDLTKAANYLEHTI